MIAERVAARYLEATRPILIDRSQVKKTMDGYRKWLLSHDPDARPDSDPSSRVDRYSPVVYVAFIATDDEGFSGGFGRMKDNRGVVKVFIPNHTFKDLALPFMLKEAEEALFHELTHAADHLNITYKTKKRITDQSPSLEDVGGGAAYYNDPSEVRAFMRELFEEIHDTVKHLMSKLDFTRKYNLAMAIKIGLASSDKWKQMQSYLTSMSFNRIMKGLVRAFQDEALG
jgi:hypothetical protein